MVCVSLVCPFIEHSLDGKMTDLLFACIENGLEMIVNLWKLPCLSIRNRRARARTADVSSVDRRGPVLVDGFFSGRSHGVCSTFTAHKSLRHV